MDSVHFTRHEFLRLGLEPLLPPLYRAVRRSLRMEAKRDSPVCNILDVGGRKSPYTIGVPGRITIIDLPRESDIQRTLHLGITETIVGKMKKRRSNLEAVIFADRTDSGLPSDFYDVVVSVEVLEHVEDDEKFVSEVGRVLKPGGRFIMTTPNGDFLENHNPDHKRHYKRHQLVELLERHFAYVKVDYAIAGGYFRKLGLRSWSATRPFRTASSMIGNIINSAQSRRSGISRQAIGTHHLIAWAEKSRDLAAGPIQMDAEAEA